MIEQSLWKITAFILVIILLIIFPILHMLEKQDEIIQIRLMDEVDHFLSQVTAQGKISAQSYEQFQTKLNALGQPFNVSLLHEKKVFVPIYTDPTDATTFTGKMAAVYDEIPSDEIKRLLFPENSMAKQDYAMSKGDYLTVVVKSSLKSKAQIMKEAIWQVHTDAVSYYVRLSGRIAHETP